MEKITSPSGGFDLDHFWREHDSALLSTQFSTHGDLSLTHDLYRGMPPWFNAFFAHFQHKAIRRLLKRIPNSLTGRGLDIGCGTGRWNKLLQAMQLKAFGMDIGILAVQIAAHQYPEASFVIAKLPTVCFKPDSFSLAISVMVLQHVPYTSQLTALQAIQNSLIPNGYLLVCESIHPKDPSPYLFGNTGHRWKELFYLSEWQIVASYGCEFLPFVTIYQWIRQFFFQFDGVLKRRKGEVGAVADFFHRHSIFAQFIRVVLYWAYPLEYLSSACLPMNWARVGCFLLKKV